MADLRDTQHPIEVVINDGGALRDTQNPIEVIVNDAGELRDTQNAIELVVNAPNVLRDTQSPVEVVLNFNVARLSETGEFVDLVLDERGRFVFGRTADPQETLVLEDGRRVFEMPIIPDGPPGPTTLQPSDTVDLSDALQSQLTKRTGDQSDITDVSQSQLTKRLSGDQLDFTDTVSTQIVQPVIPAPLGGLFSGLFGLGYLGRFGAPVAAPNVQLLAITDALDVADVYRLQLNKRLDDNSNLSDGSANQLTKRSTDQIDFSETQQKSFAKSFSDRLEVTDSFLKSLRMVLTERQDLSDSSVAFKSKTATGTDVQDITETLRRILTKQIADPLDLTDSFVKQQTKRITDRLDLTDSANPARVSGSTQVGTASDILDLTDGSRKILTKRIAEQTDFTDAASIFLHQLLQTVAATDMQTFTDQVMLQLLTRELQFFDAVNLSDVSTEFIVTFAQSLEVLMAGIRTFTCTPGYAIQREAMTMTTVVDFDNAGLHGTFGRSSRPSYRFRVPILALTKVQVDSLNAFHMFHQGGKPFYWDGGRYGYIGTPQLVGEGDGSRTQFYLPNRNIDANSISVQVLHNSVASVTTAFSLQAVPGIITFATAPVSGDDIQVAHAHKYLVKFEPDGLRTEEIFSGIFRAELILREALV